MEKIEYRVRPVMRYVVTRYSKGSNSVGSEVRGEYDNERVAYEVGYALCKAEHERLGWPPGDERIQYPTYFEPPIVPAIHLTVPEAKAMGFDVEE